MNESMAFPLLALGALAWVFPKAKQRLELSRAKHRSLAGHSRIAKRIAGLLPGYNYDETVFFNSDGASSAAHRPSTATPIAGFSNNRRVSGRPFTIRPRGP